MQQLSLLELPKETVICVFGLYSCRTLDGRDLLLLQHLLAVRAVIVQLAFFLHIQASLPVVSLKFSCGLFSETQMITAVYGLCCLFPESCPNCLSIIYQTFVFRRPAMFSRPLIFATGFMTFFSVVIALFKVIANRMFCLL